MLTGIIQSFAADQDSEFEVDSSYKKPKAGSSQCTKNSKRKEGKKIVFKKKGDHEDSKEDEKLEHTTETWVNKQGKLEKIQLNGMFQ